MHIKIHPSYMKAILAMAGAEGAAFGQLAFSEIPEIWVDLASEQEVRGFAAATTAVLGERYGGAAIVNLITRSEAQRRVGGLRLFLVDASLEG